MHTVAGDRARRGGIDPATLRRRSIDAALFLLWTVLGFGNVSGAIQEVQAEHWIAAAHRATVATCVFVNGVLFLLRGPAIKRGAGALQTIAALVGTWSVIPLSLQPTNGPDWLLATVSVGLILVYAWVLWALLTLRRSFSILPEARQLVRHGPYALIRHPLYAAYIATYVLIALPRFSALAVALAAAGITAEVIRARYEERVLAGAFPEYANYAAETPRFLPRLG